jgi:lysophospholipase
VGAPAPLVSIVEAPAPGGAHAEWFHGAGGRRLRAALFPASGPARGAVVLSPGRTEPIEKYFEVIGELTRRGFQVLAHDWRGQGLSERLLDDRLKGHAAGFEDFLEDYRALLVTFGPRLAKPWLALSHSMGACLTLLALSEGEARFSGAILSAPMLSVVTRPWPNRLARVIVGLSLGVGNGPRVVGPSYDPLSSNYAAAVLTHDGDRFGRFSAQLRACPELALGPPTWSWLAFALDAGAALAAPGALEAISIPVAFILAGEDRLVDNTAAWRAAKRLTGARCVEIPGAFHEILMETDERRAVFWAEFDRLAEEVTPQRG